MMRRVATIASTAIVLDRPAVARHLLAQRGELERDRGQALLQVVVQLAGDPVALALLGRVLTRQQAAQPLLGALVQGDRLLVGLQRGLPARPRAPHHQAQAADQGADAQQRHAAQEHTRRQALARGVQRLQCDVCQQRQPRDGQCAAKAAGEGGQRDGQEEDECRGVGQPGQGRQQHGQPRGQGQHHASGPFDGPGQQGGKQSGHRAMQRDGRPRC
jgi:hypothetical protein